MNGPPRQSWEGPLENLCFLLMMLVVGGAGYLTFMRQLNFGARTLRRTISDDSIGREIDRYDPVDAAAVCGRIRRSSDIDLLVDQYIALYDEICALPPADGDEMLAVSRALSRMASHLYARPNGVAQNLPPSTK